MNKILICLTLIFLSFNLVAEEKSKKTPEEIFQKCETLPPLAKKKYESICEKAETAIKSKYYPFTSFRMGVDYVFTDISATDKNTGGKLDLASDSNVKLNAKFLQHISPSFKTYIEGSYQKIKFNNQLNRPLVNPNQGLFGVGGGLIFNLSKKVFIDIGASYEENFYVRAAQAPQTATNLKMDKYASPNIKGKISGDVYSFGAVDLGLSAGAGITLPFNATDRDDTLGNYKVKMGYFYGGGIFARKQLDNISIQGDLEIKKYNTETSYVKSSQMDVGIGFKIAIPFGWNKVVGE